MRPAKRWAAGLLSLLLAMTMAGCQFLPSEDYEDYDVSGYIQALLDSSYHNSHDRFIILAQTDQAGAQANNTTTVQNAAVHFCNAYNISPTEDQLDQLEAIMSQALSSSQYTVKDERRVDTGYYIEVEVTPVTTLAGLESDFSQLRTQAQDEADAANAANATPAPEDTGDEEDEWSDEEESPTPAPTATPEPANTVDAYELYVDKIIQLCQNRLVTPEYQSTSVTIALDIRQTSEGELQLDMNQIETIDQTVLIFKR